ncbi:polyphosphate polymerase domain-containing protein [Actinokineospora guangxiensis]|uniref:Polyphosphate polymerase domain-containing protein n=1 Tax=Actinokineospora guangxiensis TaxID=1490288 RepID=A0ABW0EPU9_9PSEU
MSPTASTWGPASTRAGAMSAAEAALERATGLVEPIGLAEVLETAELQTRVDRKYFVPAELFGRFTARLALRVLEIDGLRVFGYESVYFDTRWLTSYRNHVQRRRRRYKIRTRTYTDTGLCLFEVKLEGHRGSTVKERVPHPADQRDRITGAAADHLDRTLRAAYAHAAPTGLRKVLTTDYRRATFTLPAEGARLTCDVSLHCHDGAASVRDTGRHVLVESKSGAGGSSADRLLRDLGVRPISMSKYCVGVAALHPGVPSNPWRRMLRQHFEPGQG